MRSASGSCRSAAASAAPSRTGPRSRRTRGPAESCCDQRQRLRRAPSRWSPSGRSRARAPTGPSVAASAPVEIEVARRVRVAALGDEASVRTAAASPIGTLMNRIHRQLSRSVSTPPSSTPAAPPAPPIAPQIPTARLRAGPSVNVVVRIAQRCGRDHGAAEPLRGPRSDQHTLAVGEAADKRRGREQNEAVDEHAAAPEQVRGAAAQQQEAGERDGVRVDDPLKIDLGEVQRVADRGQRDVDDRDVENHHELRQARRGSAWREDVDGLLFPYPNGRRLTTGNPQPSSCRRAVLRASWVVERARRRPWRRARPSAWGRARVMLARGRVRRPCSPSTEGRRPKPPSRASALPRRP